MNCITPIEKPVVAKVHSPIYLMHRYFARRPHNLFQALISHYTREGEIILDPFLGGGVTVVEGLSLSRKVIGVDLNPMAVMITELEVARIDLKELLEKYNRIISDVEKDISQIYRTECECGNGHLAWVEHSEIAECHSCGKTIVLSKVKKVNKGEYECLCGSVFGLDKKRIPRSIPVRIKCICGRIREASREDIRKFERYEDRAYFDNFVSRYNLEIPNEKIPLGKKSAEMINKGYLRYSDLFTNRNLIAFSFIFKKIREICSHSNEKSGEYPVKYALELALSSCLMEGSKLAHIKNGTVVKAGHHFWTPSIFAEANVLRLFKNRFEKILKGKKMSERIIGKKYIRAYKFSDLEKGTCLLLNKSSTSLSEIPDKSVDAVITDPPYGGNVNYLELSNFWTVWLKDDFSLSSAIIDNKEEATIDCYQNKNVKDYEMSLQNVFSECNRVLKDEGWLVLTFNNKDEKVWHALFSAIEKSRFYLPKEGMIYQPPIKAYMTTLHQRAKGCAFGDFILSFKKKKF
ncbi:MAG: DNA methyltransferase [Thermoplasmata archaeon]